MKLKNLLWLPFVPLAFSFGVWGSRAICYAAIATGITCWTVMALLVIASVISTSSRTSKLGASQW